MNTNMHVCINGKITDVINSTDISEESKASLAAQYGVKEQSIRFFHSSLTQQEIDKNLAQPIKLSCVKVSRNSGIVNNGGLVAFTIMIAGAVTETGMAPPKFIECVVFKDNNLSAELDEAQKVYFDRASKLKTTDYVKITGTLGIRTTTITDAKTGDPLEVRRPRIRINTLFLVDPTTKEIIVEDDGVTPERDAVSPANEAIVEDTKTQDVPSPKAKRGKRLVAA